MAGNNAGNNQSKKNGRQQNRLSPGMAPGSSRVSNVVGGIGSTSGRGGQRANKSPGGNRGKQATKKGSSSGPAANRPALSSPPPNGTADSRAIARARNAWNNLEPHHQQRFLGIILLLLALFLFAVLTVFRTIPLFKAFNDVFIAFFGWSAYLLAIGLIAFAIAHLVEGIRNIKIIRWPFVVGLVVLWLLLLAESQLLVRGTTGGVLGLLLVRPLIGWPAYAGHILLVGLFGIFTIVTFQITFGHILQLGRAIG